MDRREKQVCWLDYSNVSKMPIQVISAGADQVQRVRALRLSALADSPAAFGAKYDVEKEKPITFWQNTVRISNWSLVSVDELDVGLLAVDRADKDRTADCWIGAWWISESYRGQGIAQLMLDWVDQLAKDNSWARMGLGVWPDNERAISAYKKLGFIAGDQLMPSRSIPGLLYLPMFRDIKGGSIE